MKDKPVGLDIGTTTMKAVWLSEVRGNFFLKAIAQSPTPQKGMLSESPFDQQEMAKGIKKMLDDAKITAPAVNISLPDSQVYTRIIEMPPISDKELALAIYWEAEQYIPLPLSKVTLDWAVLKRGKSQDSDKIRVLLVGAPTTLLDKYQKILTMAGLTINAVETEILSAIRPLSLHENSPSIIVVNIGELNTSFAIIKDGDVVFTYSVAAGGIAIDRAIANDFGFTISQAEEYKKTYGLSESGLGGKIGKATEPVLMSIVTEIKKAMRFYMEKYKNSMLIQQIVLSGVNSSLPGIDLFFAQNCSVETVIANPLMQLGIKEAPKEVIDNAADFTISIGLAMRDYE